MVQLTSSQQNLRQCRHNVESPCSVGCSIYTIMLNLMYVLEEETLRPSVPCQQQGMQATQVRRQGPGLKSCRQNSTLISKCEVWNTNLKYGRVSPFFWTSDFLRTFFWPETHWTLLGKSRTVHILRGSGQISVFWKVISCTWYK